MRYYPPAVTCKLDSPWLSPYLFVSLCGWAVGIQLQPDSAVFFAHCQALEKIPQPRSLISSLPAPGRPELGPSAVNGSALCATASGMTGLPSVPSLLQPFSVTFFYAGPVRLVLITHAFDYRGVSKCATMPQFSIVVLHIGIGQATPRPSLPCTRTIPAAECPPTPRPAPMAQRFEA